MNQWQQIKIRAPFAIAMIACGLVNSALAWDYGNGRHGSFILTTNATIEQLYQTVRLTNDPPQYNPADSNAIPNFQNLIITNGATLTANAWNGSSGGWIVLKVEATLSVASGSTISATGIGYRGGGLTYGSQFPEGIQGESYAGGQAASSGANYGGGGGGFVEGYNSFGQIFYGSAGGGGYGSGGTGGICYLDNGTTTGATGGQTYGTPTLFPCYFGSGGGGNANSSAGGGAGGGAIILNVGHLQVSGQILANGNSSSGGGSGSGGSILLQTALASFGTNIVSALGGGSGYGGGGVGRIAIYYAESYSGTSTPAAYTLQDTNSDNVTVITNQPSTQTNFLGASVNFNVGAYGQPTLNFQWNFNNTPISGATNPVLSLPSIALTNTGNYSVTVSNAVMTIVSSNAFLKVLDTAIPLNDGIPNWWKEEYGLSTNDPTLATNYPPADSQLTYLEKYLYGLNPLTNDTDGDGLTDYDEIFIYHTSPLLGSTAGDAIPDGWKVQYGLNALIPIADSEAGFDGVTYIQIYKYDLTHTNSPLNPNTPFAVGQGLSSYEIINGGQHTNKFYYDHEDRLLGMESSRGISIGYQYDGNGNLLQQAVLSRTVETNGLPVLWLWLNGLTNQPGIAYANSSGNGWDNYQEWLAGLSPNSNSMPSLLNNPGTNIATLAVPFTPTNWVMAAGALNGVAGDEVVVGADGNPGTNNNSLFVMSQTATNWSMQQISVGSYGITSIAVGQPTNRPSPGIYIGLRGTNGSGQIMEFTSNGGIWQSNGIAISTNPAVFVIGVRSNNDLLANLSPTNALNGALYRFTYLNSAWNQVLVSSNSSHRVSGTVGNVLGGITRQASLRFIDSGGIEIAGLGIEFLNNRTLIPSNSVYYPKTDKWYYTTAGGLDWSTAESACQSQGGNLVTISSADENQWLTNNYFFAFHIGKYYSLAYNGHFYWSDAGWISGKSSSYQNWANGQPNLYCNPNVISGFPGTYMGINGQWNTEGNAAGNTSIGPTYAPGVGEYSSAGGLTILPEISVTTKLSLDNESLRPCFTRPYQTNGFSIVSACVDDKNQSGKIDAGDDFVVEELVVTTNSWTTNTLFRSSITSTAGLLRYAIAAADFTGTGKDTLFTGEPDGRIYSWTGNDATNPLQRQLFSDAYVGQAWQAMSGVQTSGLGKGLAGALVNPTNQSMCNVIYWQPQPVLPTPAPSIIETAPYAAVIPSSATLGSNAVVTVRLWDNEGDASTPFLQYQILGAANWQPATLTTLDGLSYNSTMRVAALPTGSTHFLTWNALGDVGANVVTNILLRASAQDFMLTGSWSVATPFQLNTTVVTVSNPTNPPVNFTGIMPVQGGIQFNWQGGSNAWLYLQRSPALAGTNVNWVNIWTGAPPMPISGSYTDFFGTSLMEFYRMRVVNP